MDTEKAILAGGCFWGVEELFRHYPGVISTVVGYTGGDVPDATYRNHGSHAEAIAIMFDPAKLSYRKLLEYFFQIHDPTTRNRQGNDTGTSYRSAIFFMDEAQLETAKALIADMEASGKWPGKIVTEVVLAGPVLERRKGTPGLPAKTSLRIYLPLRKARLGAGTIVKVEVECLDVYP
jgi:peptide-methionine (S)-S-oxide reductase